MTESELRAANNDLMDPHWRPSDIRADAPPKTHAEPRPETKPCYECLCRQQFEHPEERTAHSAVCDHFQLALQFSLLTKQYAEVNEGFRRLRMEIDTRWEPALKKAQHNANVFQQELMDKHEELVERLTAARERHNGDLKDAHLREDKLKAEIRLHMQESELLWRSIELRSEDLEPIGKEAADLEDRAANIRAQWGGK